MDRYSDMVPYMGLMILYARVDRTPLMVLVRVAAFGSFMTSYARARAESLIPGCNVGFLERPERIALVILGALLNRMIAALWITAVLRQPDGDPARRLHAADAAPDPSEASRRCSLTALLPGARLTSRPASSGGRATRPTASRSARSNGAPRGAAQAPAPRRSGDPRVARAAGRRPPS